MYVEPHNDSNPELTNDDDTQHNEAAHRVIAEQHVLAQLALHPCEHIVGIGSAQDPGAATINFVTIEDDLLTLVSQQPMPPPAVRMIVLSLVRALGHLHELGFIHRDIKPENLRATPRGRFMLTDFSLASSQPTARSLIGTPEFMAPEIILGHTYTDAVDWWALGCLICELLTGESPFNEPAKSVSVLSRKILYDAIALPTHEHVGPLEREFIMALVVRDPSARLGARGAAQVLGHFWCIGDANGGVTPGGLEGGRPV